MDIDRRSLMKLFGVGAIIVPVIGGVPAKEEALVIEPPKVEVVPANLEMPALKFLSNGMRAQRAMACTLFIRDPDSGAFARMEVHSISSRPARYDFQAYLTDFTLNAPVGGMHMLEAGFAVTGPIELAGVRK